MIQDQAASAPDDQETVTIDASEATLEVPAEAIEDALPQDDQITEEAEAALDDAGDTMADGVEAAGEALGRGDPESAIGEILQTERLQQIAGDLLIWVQEEVLTINMIIQLSLIVAAVAPALFFGPKLKRFIQRHLRERAPSGLLRRGVDAMATVATLIALWVTLTIFMSVLRGFGQSAAVISAVQSLLLAAIFIRIVTLAIRSAFWSKVAFYVAWPIAALDAFGILDNVVRQLEAASITLVPAEGNNPAATLSALDIVRAAIIFAIIFWLASVVSSLITRRLDTVDELNPSFKALLSKVLSFIMPIIALVIALQMIGFNLASLAVFSGAVGLGIGLGLQKIIGNFLAGFTLLADKSIKPGDTVQVGDTFGWITEMKSRYVAIRTRDGHNHLVPNADFIDNGVVNWSHNDRAVRIHAPFGVTYNQRDLRLVQQIATDAAKSTERVLETPKPVCNLMGFGDSSVDFDLRFWINDPPNGISNVRSEVMMKIWDQLHEHGIEIPFPQRDLHIRSSEVDFVSLPKAAE